VEVTFLGTGTSQGVPLIGCQCQVCLSTDLKDNRLRSSLLINDKDCSFVIDTGPDFRQQMLRENVRQLDAVLFTHEHKDHIAGLDDVRAFNFIQSREMDVFATSRVQDAIKREFAYIFSEEKYPGIPEIKLHTFDQQSFFIKHLQILPIDVMHYKMPVKAFRIGDFVYITDANHISEKEKEKIKGAKIIVLNALRRHPHISHYTLEEALHLIEEFKPEKAFLTHISHQLGTHEMVSSELPANVFLAYDGLKIEITN
jgi:phosphoribosyl 1,2-cyclic phosphate phosphodiesterase